MSDVALIRSVFPRGTVKRLALLAGTKVATARSWLYRAVPADRRPAIAALLLAELDRQDAERARQRRRIEAWLESAGVRTPGPAE